MPTPSAEQSGIATASGLVYSAALQADGRFIVGGAFSTINGTARTRIARLSTSGVLDPDFHPAVSAGTDVTGLSLHSDDKLPMPVDSPTSTASHAVASRA